MSADNNWTYCPRCHKQIESSKSIYGKVSEKEYLEFLDKPVSIEEPTLREDYELGITLDKKEGWIFYIIYMASCDCGFRFKYRHKELLPSSKVKE